MLHDQLSGDRFEREGDEIASSGLYVDLRRDPLRQSRLGPVRGHYPVATVRTPFADAGDNGTGGPGDRRGPAGEPDGGGADSERVPAGAGGQRPGAMTRVRDILGGSR